MKLMRLSQVSKFFRRMTEAGTIWRSAYRTTSLPRHSGPFLHQSSETLKEFLLKSARLACNWAPHKPIPTRRRSIQGAVGEGTYRLFLGRWLMNIAESTHIKYADLDSADTPSVVVYRSDVDVVIHGHAYISTTSLDGHVLAFAIVWERNIESLIQTIKVFKAVDHAGPALSLELAASYPVNWTRSERLQPALGPRLLVIVGDPVHDEVLYVDLETFMTFTVSLPPIQQDFGVRVDVAFIPCVTHLLVVRSPIARRTNSAVFDSVAFFDAFGIPPIGSEFRHDTLKLSHHGRHPVGLTEVTLLHDPAIDPWRGEPHILLFAGIQDDAETDQSYGVVRLAMSTHGSPGVLLCGVQNIFPRHPERSRRILFASDLGGSKRGISRGSRDEFDAHSLTLDGSEVSHAFSSNILPELCADEEHGWVVGIDGHRGRVVFGKVNPHPTRLEVYDFV
ncbi:hypothetical protein BV22DRAFT_10431 [Leucogyrophana mollusca]|uniref:Uncharacterized protein n=1 Tax=Leucogyrophana mollusca TaxID=85980 RepID=A0ACB8C071_9AGAM|nr:hypothetical protein BV22DRAFT_10431 [Leucogyrophana mollusca]